MTSSRRLRRTASAAALLAAGCLAVPTAHSTASAGAAAPAPPAGAVSRSGSPTSATDRVAAFYGAYIDALYDSGHGRLAAELRNHYLTPTLRERLGAWEQQNDSDGVLQGQDVPHAWMTTYGSRAAGATWTRVRLAWGSAEQPKYTYLNVRSDTATRRISDIQEAPKVRPPAQAPAQTRPPAPAKPPVQAKPPGQRPGPGQGKPGPVAQKPGAKPRPQGAKPHGSKPHKPRPKPQKHKR